MRVKILTPNLTLGRQGETVELPDWIDADALIAAGSVEPVADKPAARAPKPKDDSDVVDEKAAD